MDCSVCCFLNSLNIDWIAIFALVVAIISVIIAVKYNRETLKLTEVHNKKSVEPLMTDLYISKLVITDDKKPSQAYQIKNCGFGPAIIKSYFFEIDGKKYINVNDIFKQYFKGQNYSALTEFFTIALEHVIAPNETLSLFIFYFDDVKLAMQFDELAKRLSFQLEFETIYKEPRRFFKEKLNIR